MLVKKYPAEVVEIQNPVDTLYVLKLRSKEKPFKFLPGQFLHLAIDDYDPSAGWPESRCFSIHGWDEHGQITLTFSIKGRYTSRMARELVQGKILWVKMPYGSLFQDIPDKTGCIFIAGGTGITPFLSLFTDKSFENFDNPKLYAGFRSKPYNLYEGYLSRAKDVNNKFEYYIKYEDKDGMLDIAEICMTGKQGSLYFLSGPPKMIEIFRQHLEKSGINKANIRTDDWE